MNPNPYRSAMFAIAMLGITLGALLLLVAVTSSNVTASFNLGAIGGFLLSLGCSFFVLWLVVSAILYGLTISPKLTAGTTAASWLGFGDAEKENNASYLDEDGR